MRSYKYENGIWTSINDPLPPPRIAVRPRRDREDDLPPPFTGPTLSDHGFGNTRATTLACKAGTVEIHARNHGNMNMKRQVNEFPYDFLCEFTLNGSDIRVWVVDFPSLLRFLSEIEARPEPHDETVDTSAIHDLLSIASSVLNDLYLGNLEITVKPPKPPKKSVE